MLKKYTTEPLQEYTSNGTRLFVIIMPLYVVLLNLLLFGSRFFSTAYFALISFAITFAFMAIVWRVHAGISLILKDKIPEEKYYFKQLAVKLALFISFKSVVLTLMYTTYVKMGYLEEDSDRLIWLLIAGNIFNVSVTLLHDGSRGFDKWKTTLIETEQLRKSYLLSQLMNLKSQVNPHFLFRNLDALGTLMHKDANEAETYLNEMSKVYQYFLKTSDVSLVPLQDEISFLQSYYFLIKTQYKERVRLEVHPGTKSANAVMPPYTLQALFENALKGITGSEVSNMSCHLLLTDEYELQFESRLAHSQFRRRDGQQQLLLENVIRKFSLLTQQAVAVKEDQGCQTIVLPLIKQLS